MAYTKNTNFTAKDALATGNPAKVIKGSEFDTEFDEIATESAKTVEKTASQTLSGANTHSGNNTFSGDNTFSGTNTHSGEETFSASVYFSKGSDVASATALALGTDGNYFDVTGTTTITSINTWGVGAVAKLHFDGILTLTHHATDLILPGGANITTAAGDEAEFVEYASGDWRCTAYTKADGTAVVVGAGSNVFETIAVSGQSDVVADSSTDTLTLVAGTNVTITTDAGADSITINSTATGGKLLQRVEATPYTANTTLTTTLPLDDTIPQNTEGDQILTAAITPADTANRLVIEAYIPNVGVNTATATVTAALFQDATAAALTASAVYMATDAEEADIVLRWEMAAGTTSSTTFKVRVGASTGNCSVNGSPGSRKFGGVSAARLSVTEID